MKGGYIVPLVHYHIRYQALSPEEREKLVDQINSVAFTGLSISDDFRSGDFYLTSEDELRFIDIPDSCVLMKL